MNKILRIALLIVTVLVYSCRVQDTVESIYPVNQTITVEEAKDFINSQKTAREWLMEPKNQSEQNTGKMLEL